MSHTPGPWKVSTGLIFSDGFLVADPFVGEHENHPPEHFPEYAANARLIAAAPDLLAACEAALAAMQKNIAYAAYKDEHALANGIEVVRAAIARAKEQPCT